jgi:hypothetical protein
VQRRSGGSRYIFKEAQEIGDSFTLAVGEDRVIDAVLGASAAAGAAELGEELGNAHDAVCLSGFAGLGSLPVSVEGRRWQRQQSQAR